MSHDLEYEERSAPPDLVDTLRCVWRLTGSAPAPGAEAVQPIVPYGCPEIVINVGDPFVRSRGSGPPERQPLAMLVGQMTAPAVVGPTGTTRIVGIRFQPWGAARFLGIPLVEVRDSFLELDSVVSDGMRHLADRLHATPDPTWADVVFDEVRWRLERRRRDPARLAAAAVREIRLHGGRVSVRGLARRLHVGERQLERVMRRDVGLPPVVLARILRVQAALGEMLSDPKRPLSAVALGAGFYDQPHFVREFRRLVGCTPSEFRAEERPLTDHFIDVR
jgi:AraC-like DNA-binding protein